jgi:hypothetical protein
MPARLFVDLSVLGARPTGILVYAINLTLLSRRLSPAVVRSEAPGTPWFTADLRAHLSLDAPPAHDVVRGPSQAGRGDAHPRHWRDAGRLALPSVPASARLAEHQSAPYRSGGRRRQDDLRAGRRACAAGTRRRVRVLFRLLELRHRARRRIRPAEAVGRELSPTGPPPLGTDPGAWGLLTRLSQAEIDEQARTIRLLGYREMRELFPDCRILVEWFCFMLKGTRWGTSGRAAPSVAEKRRRRARAA